MVESFARLGSLAEGASFDLSKLGLDIGDIHAVLTVDERTHLLDSALVSFEMRQRASASSSTCAISLSGANKPVTLPSPSG